MNKLISKSLSLVIPCHNEESNIEKTFQIYDDIIKKMFKKKNISDYEIIAVNNGSTDNTLVKLKQFKKNKMKVINLDKNYGYTSSYLAGIYVANFEMIITVTADLHEDPYKIQEMVDKHYSTQNNILGVYQVRHDTILKNFFANSFYKFIKLVDIKSLYHHADFRLITNETKSRIFLKKRPFIFLRFLILKITNDYDIVEYSGNKRLKDKSKFNYISSLKMAIDSIIYYGNIKKLNILLNTIYIIFSFIIFYAIYLFFMSNFINIIIFSLIYFAIYIFFYFTVKNIINKRKSGLNIFKNLFHIKEIIK